MCLASFRVLLERNDISGMDYKALESIYEREDSYKSFSGKEWRMPAGVIAGKRRIVIYGAGEVGEYCFSFFKEKGDKTELLWVDRDYASKSDLVKSPEEIIDFNPDIVIIAINDDGVRESVKTYLTEEGVSETIIYSSRPVVKSRLDDLFEPGYQKADSIYWSEDHHVIKFEKPLSVTSMICNQSLFDMPFSQYWGQKVSRNFRDLMEKTGQLSPEALYGEIVYHRKLWEFIYICQALYENDMLRSGRKGVAFGVGEECLPDLFASMGCDILATDLDYDRAKERGWTESGQNTSNNASVLNKYHFCDDETFAERVSFREVDMNSIPEDINGFDFCWSACALEHLGSIQKGMDFIKNSLKTLNPGGIAIHTTEFNLYSNTYTLESENLSLFRRSDIEILIKELESLGNYVYPMDWHIGNGVVDKFVDLPPYSRKDMHLRLKIDDFPCTSIGLIIRKQGRELT